MRYSTFLLGSGMVLLGACMPIARVVLGVKPPRAETTAAMLAFAQQDLQLPAGQVFAAGTALYAAPGSDTLLYAAPGQPPAAKAPGTTYLDLPVLMLFDGQGRGARAVFTGNCTPGHPNRIRAGLEQLPAATPAGLLPAAPALGAYQLNASFNSVGTYFTQADGQPLRFEAVRNGSQAYIAVFGAKFMPRMTRKTLLQARETAALRPDLRVTVLYFDCDFTPDAYAQADARHKRK